MDGNNLNGNNLNGNTVTNINRLSHVNIDTPVDANTLSDVPVANTNQNKGTTANKSRKRKSDNADLVLPEGSRRIRKKKSRADENIPVSTKRTKKQKSGRK